MVTLLQILVPTVLSLVMVGYIHGSFLKLDLDWDLTAKIQVASASAMFYVGSMTYAQSFPYKSSWSGCDCEIIYPGWVQYYILSVVLLLLGLAITIYIHKRGRDR